VQETEQTEQTEQTQKVELLLDANKFHSALAAVNPARLPATDYRPLLECFHVVLHASGIQVSATDSYMALRAKYDEMGFHTEEPHTLVFGQNLKLADMKSVLAEKTVRLEIDSKSISFSTMSRSHVLKVEQTEGSYPNMDTFISDAQERAEKKCFDFLAFNAAIFSKILAGQKAYLKIAKVKPEFCAVKVLTTDSLKPSLMSYTTPDFPFVHALLMPVRTPETA
jgi:DNA polymerase III sliding clamp (beta) subunit (PCNA family)